MKTNHYQVCYFDIASDMSPDCHSLQYALKKMKAAMAIFGVSRVIKT